MIVLGLYSFVFNFKMCNLHDLVFNLGDGISMDKHYLLNIFIFPTPLRNFALPCVLELSLGVGIVLIHRVEQNTFHPLPPPSDTCITPTVWKPLT